MAVVGEHEWVDDGVEVDDGEGEEGEEQDEMGSREEIASFEEEEGFQVGELSDAGEEGQGGHDEAREEEWPGEEGDEGPDVEHLWKVDGCDVVRLVAEDYTTVPDDEAEEYGD